MFKINYSMVKIKTSKEMMMEKTKCMTFTNHLLLAKMLTKFLTVNNYIDEKVQKAFLPGINGTIKHNVVLEVGRREETANHSLKSSSCKVEKMDIFEPTKVPLETNSQNTNTQKMNKYEHFITDITTRAVYVQCSPF